MYVCLHSLLHFHMLHTHILAFVIHPVQSANDPQHVLSSSVLQCVALCCSMLQCVSVCCSVLQCVAVCCSVLQCAAVCCSVLKRVAVCGSVLHCVAVVKTHKMACSRFLSTNKPLKYRALLQKTTRREKLSYGSSLLQHAATRCNMLQHATTHCNILQQTENDMQASAILIHHCNTLQHAVTFCNTLQHTATHRN